jgi:transposase
MGVSRKGVSYSEDLRLRVVDAIDNGMSKMKAHQTFQVSRSTIDDWLKLRAETGSVLDKPRVRRGKAPAISDWVAFEAFAKRHTGATLRHMALAWEEETGQKLSQNTFSVMLRRIGWTRKKSDSSTENDVKPSEPSSSNN